MALYAFDGTWNSDEDKITEHTNVVKFSELYVGNNSEYISGVGTRFGKPGQILGGLFGIGGRSRISEMYDELCDNWENGDPDIDIIGFSRGAALAVHFANKIGEDGIKLSNGTIETNTKIRFLGLWDIVGSFGLPFNTVINFQEINIGWDIDTVHNCVKQCYHAMALDERRETFNVTRLDPDNKCDNVHEVWFRGVHSDIGGGNGNSARSNIALGWMLEKAREQNLKFNETKAALKHYNETDRFSTIYQNIDAQIDPRRIVQSNDVVHPTAEPLELNENESHTIEVFAIPKYNWTGVHLTKGLKYSITVKEHDTWTDAEINCGPAGWNTEELPWYKEPAFSVTEKFRRLESANWFALTGSYGDEDGENGDNLFLIGDYSTAFVAEKDADLYLFANDHPWTMGTMMDHWS